MCDPMMLIGGVMGLFSMFNQPSIPEPPKAETPAIAAPTSRTPGATVRLGAGEDDISNSLTNEPNQPMGFTERRSSGNSLGNLGKSGLAL